MKNICLYGVAREENKNIDIYIKSSGKQMYLMTHRWNIYIYDLLKDGIRLDELERDTQKVISGIALTGKRFYKGDIYPRLKSKKNYSEKLHNSIQHIMAVANGHLSQEVDKITA